MYLKQLFAFIAASIILVSCDDNTSTLGMDMVPVSDLIAKTYKTYDVKTSSYAVGDSVLARSSTSYFGQFTDPLTNTTVKCDFISQYNSSITDFQNTVIGDSAFYTSVTLYLSGFTGDSLAPLNLEVYEIDSVLDKNADYYTNIDPSKYVKKDAKPIGKIRFSVSDRTITDSTRYAYLSSSSAIPVVVPLDKSVGNGIIKALQKDTTLVSPGKWSKSGLSGSKGLYFKLSGGDGAMCYIYNSLFRVYYRYHDTTEDKDSITALCFEGTEEVIQASRFVTSNVDKLAEDTSVTYLKSPAGIFTMVEFPVDSISVNDTINSASVKFTRYNDDAEASSKVDKNYRLGIPKYVLMVRYDDYKNGFFENYKLADNLTSYTAEFSSTSNTYEFKNISRLISTMLQEKKNGTAGENYNKVLLIPIEITQNSSKQIVKISHDLGMNSARLVGGKDGGVQMEVIYSKFVK